MIVNAIYINHDSIAQSVQNFSNKSCLFEREGEGEKKLEIHE